jgi:L-lactate permease
VLTGARSEELDEEGPPREVLRAYAPYALIVVIFSVAQTPAVKDRLAGTIRTTTGPSRTSPAPTANRSAATSSAGRSVDRRHPLLPVLGWFDVTVTGSDTSANALFGALQVTAARAFGLPPDLPPPPTAPAVSSAR